MAERTDDRVVRLITMVSYVSRVGEASVQDLAARYGVSEEQVLADVNVLWLTGLPGYWTNDLVDFDADALDRQIVRVTQAHGLDRPLRLGTNEAVALVAALRALVSVAQDAADEESLAVLHSTLDVLTRATGEAAAALDVDLHLDSDPSTLAAVRKARDERRRLRVRYTDANDMTRDRVVEPLRVDSGDGRTYVQVWAPDVGALRTLRADRVLEAEVLDEAATHPGRDVPGTDARRQPDPDDPRVFAAADQVVRVRLDSSARAVAESVPHEDLTDHEDGSFTLTLRVHNQGWLEHLVLSTADDILDLEPPQVATAAVARARDALGVYARLDLS